MSDDWTFLVSFEAGSSPRWSAGVGPLPSSFVCLAGVITIKVKRLPHVIHPFLALSTPPPLSGSFNSEGPS